MGYFNDSEVSPIEDEIKFDKQKMKKMVSQDVFLKRFCKDFGTTGKTLEIAFNSFVLGDSAMERIYKEL